MWIKDKENVRIGLMPAAAVDGVLIFFSLNETELTSEDAV